MFRVINFQKSFADDERACLYIVPTPIGNLEDITFRALRILKEVDLIAAEDTRQTKKLLNHYDITTFAVSYHDHNKQKSGEKIIAELKLGKNVAIVSDAGMPSISDPGFELVEMAIKEGIVVIPLPGANAALPALSASGLPTDHFYFYGFLNRKKKDKKDELEKLKMIKDTIILYESPHRLKETLETILEILGDRKISVCRELTKRYEEFIRGDVREIYDWFQKEEARGEFCLILEGNLDTVKDEPEWWSDLTVNEHIQHFVTIKNMSPKEAIKAAAKERNIPKREAYQAYHINE
jgi:16S rRNA (cytidine1402-2'-O)-methyltransferase